MRREDLKRLVLEVPEGFALRAAPDIRLLPVVIIWSSAILWPLGQTCFRRGVAFGKAVENLV